MSDEPTPPPEPGLTYIPKVDALLVKFFHGVDTPEQAKGNTVTGDDEGDINVNYLVGISGRLLSLAIAPASRWIPPAILRNGHRLVLEPVRVDDRPDTVAFPLFRDAFTVGRQIVEVEIHGGVVALLTAPSGRVVAIIVGEASRRLPPELIP